jgi:FixJ family two-component response regulator
MVYLIDDDKFERRGFEIFLNSTGMEHKSFGNAEDYLSTVKPESTDILVLDLHLSGMNGCELLNQMKSV